MAGLGRLGAQGLHLNDIWGGSRCRRPCPQGYAECGCRGVPPAMLQTRARPPRPLPTRLRPHPPISQAVCSGPMPVPSHRRWRGRQAEKMSSGVVKSGCCQGMPRPPRELLRSSARCPRLALASQSAAARRPSAFSGRWSATHLRTSAVLPQWPQATLFHRRPAERSPHTRPAVNRCTRGSSSRSPGLSARRQRPSRPTGGGAECVRSRGWLPPRFAASVPERARAPPEAWERSPCSTGAKTPSTLHARFAGLRDEAGRRASLAPPTWTPRPPSTLECCVDRECAAPRGRPTD